jgi:pimeloyl-ACP methyl ester carboxylesterase
MNDATALIARITAGGDKDISWVGTSMGGMLGMLLAAKPNNPIRRLVLNDVGTLIPKASMERIGAYVGKNPLFSSFAEFELYVRKVSAPFGPLSDAQWRHLAEHNARCDADGRWGMIYDPDIAQPFRKAAAKDIVLWSYYDAIRCPTLLLRGADSDLLLHETAVEMTQRGPKPQLVEFAGVGHAPALMADEQIAAVRKFLVG